MTKTSNIGEFLYIFGIVMAVVAGLGGIFVGYAIGELFFPYSESGTIFLFGILLGACSAAMMLLISGFGKLISDVDTIRRRVEANDESFDSEIHIDSI